MSTSNFDTDYDDGLNPATEVGSESRRTSAEQARKAAADEIKALNSLYHAPAQTADARRDNQPKGITSTWVRRKLRGKGSLITLGMLLFGGGGFLTVFFTPAMALSQFTQMLTESLNDQYHAVEQRSEKLLHAKLSDVTKGSCGYIKIACRFATMSDVQAKKFEKAGIKVTREPSKLLPNRGQITSMEFTDASGKKVTIKTAEELHRYSLENIDFRAAQTKAYNPMFATMTDKVVTKVLQRLKARKMPVIGDTDEERQKRYNNVVANGTDVDTRTIVESEDDKKNKTYSVDGEDISAEQASSAETTDDLIKSVKEGGGYSGFVSGASRVLNAAAIPQNACAMYTIASVGASVGQLQMAEQAARLALEGPLSTESSVRAGEAQEGTVSFMGKLITTPSSDSKVIDEGALANTASIATKLNSSGDTAFESSYYKYAAYNEVPEKIDASDGRFILGAGTPTILKNALSGVATVVSPDNPTPQGVRSKCHIINNPLVTGAGLALGIVLGVGSFGLSTVAGIAGSVAVSLATPYFISKIADISTGDLFKNLTGRPFGQGVGVGTASFLSKIAQFRGGKPLNKEEGIKYLEKNRASTAAYTETEQYIARATPFDINNRYSFLGSLVSAATPFVESSKSSASMAMMNVASIIPTALTSLNPSAKAASVPHNYLSCNDPYILSAGINADFMCVVHYGATESELNIDPVQNAVWMANTGNVNGDTGDAKDNGQSWNYTKFLSECVYRTTGWGVANENDEADGRNCTDPKNESLNEQFRTFTMNKTIDESMDEESRPYVDDVTTYTDGNKGAVVDGWSFPTTDKASITTAFGTGEGSDKNGVTITAPTATETENLPIFAVYDGTVVATGKEQGLENRIVINHWINGKLVSTVYGHLGDNSIAVKVGDKVTAGQQIGRISPVTGGTPCLYFEMWEGPTTTGTAVDPTGTLATTRKKQEVTNV